MTARRRGTVTTEQGPVADILNAPDVSWAGRLVVSPIHRLGVLHAWEIDSDGVGRHPVSGAVLTPAADGRTVDPKATIAWELSGDRIVVESEGDHSMLVVEHDEQTDRHGFPVPARRKVRCRLAAQIDDQPALARALADRLLVRRGTR